MTRQTNEIFLLVHISLPESFKYMLSAGLDHFVASVPPPARRGWMPVLEIDKAKTFEFLPGPCNDFYFI